jgi:hypothetical protein
MYKIIIVRLGLSVSRPEKQENKRKEKRKKGGIT